MDGKVVTDKTISQQSGTEKLIDGGVLKVDTSFVQNKSSGFDGTQTLGSTETISTDLKNELTTRKQTSRGSQSNNIIHSTHENGAHKISGASENGTNQVQVRKLVAGKWVMRTVTENVNGKHEVQSSKINQRGHSNVHTTAAAGSRSVKQSNDAQSTKTIGGKHVHIHGDESSTSGQAAAGIRSVKQSSDSPSMKTVDSKHVLIHGDESSIRGQAAAGIRGVKQSSDSQTIKTSDSKHVHIYGDESSTKGQVLRNQNNTSSSIVHGGDTSTQKSTKQSATTRIIGGKLVHVAARDDSNSTSRASVSHSRSANNIIHSESSSVMNSAISESNLSSRTEAKQSSHIISQSSTSESSTADKHFNRNSAFSSTESSNNAILCRQQQSNAQPSGSSMSVSGSIQRKSISNLNDSAVYSTTNRQSYSSLHRREKESADSRMNNYIKTLESGPITTRGKLQPCAPPTMSTSTNVSNVTSSSTIGQHSSSSQQTKMLRDYHSAINVTKSSTKANASSISFGEDNKFHGTSSYKMQYVQKNDGPCPAHALNDNLKVSKVTKQHTYYVRDRR